ncbi:MAG TPA: molybdopterin-dependent oxidoreductase, partial [Anaerolineales bacterium]
NGDGIAALVSSRLPAEALHAFKSLFGDVLGSTRLASIEEDQVTAYDVASPKGNDLDALKTADCVVVIGADLAKSHQVAGFFIKRNLPNGLRLIVIDPQVNDMDDLAQFVLRLQPGSDEALLRGIIASAVKLGLNKESAPEGFEEDRTELAAVSHATGIPASTIVDVAREISSARAPVFVYGKGLTRPDAQAARQALAALAQVVGGAALINPKGKANSFAAHCYDLDRPFNPRGSQAVYLALGDDYPSARLLETLNESAFIAVQASHVSPVTQRADVVLPVEAWTEQEGHYLNLEGRLQAAHKALSAPGEARSNLAVLQELANGLGASLDENWQAALSWNVAEFVG